MEAAHVLGPRKIRSASHHRTNDGTRPLWLTVPCVTKDDAKEGAWAVKTLPRVYLAGVFRTAEYLRGMPVILKYITLVVA